MFRVLALALVSGAISVVEHTQFTDDELSDGLSLLQLRAHQNSSQQPVLYSGHAFGCEKGTRAENVISCGLWGDVHQHKSYQEARIHQNPDINGQGWQWIAKSRDDSFQMQGFWQMPAHWSTLTHIAIKMGDHKVFLDRVYSNVGGRPHWAWRNVWDGENEIAGTSTPVTKDDAYWMNYANIGGHNFRQHGAAGTHNAAAGFAGFPNSLSCFQYKTDVAMWTSYMGWQSPQAGPYTQPAAIEVEGSVDFLDPEFGACARNVQKVSPEDMLVTKEQNDKVCQTNKISAEQCEHPVVPPPPLTKEQQCEQNGVEFAHAEELCEDQKAHGEDYFEGCTYDVCASADEQAQLNAVGGAELDAAMNNPEATCIKNPNLCLPCSICSQATSVDLSNVVQNNLGGAGPAAGDEEIRYKNAIDVDGKKVDVVLTAENAYSTPKSSINGVTIGGFGRFTMKAKTSTKFKFSFLDAETNAPVAIQDLALTFYDMDQGRKGKQVESVKACGAQEAFVTSDTELELQSEGVCHTLTSTERGTGKDNPERPDELTKVQAARSVTFEFHKRASISFEASISRTGRSPRPFLFSFVPQVACGASDAETQCSQD
jgi:hypothetical protein